MSFSALWPYLLSLALSATLFAPVSTAASESQWLEIDSPHFSVNTDAGEKRGREVAQRFEQMRAVFAALMTTANVNLPIPLQIVAFRNSKELRQVVPLWHGKPVQVAGLFAGGQDRCFIMLDMSVENPWTVVFHEYAHQLIKGNIGAQLDPWFDEGFAEYFSSIEVDGKQAQVGRIPDYDYRILQQQGLMKVADLLRVQHNSAVYNESGDHQTIFYAESSMVVHYIYDHRLLAQLATYLDLKINKGIPVEAAFQQGFGMSTTQFDNELRNYISSGRFSYYPIASPSDIVRANYSVKPMTGPETNAVIADIHLHSRDYHEQAAAEFLEVLKADPNNAAATRGLGYAYLEARNMEGASEYFKRAAQLDSKDPRVHYYSALLMSREGTFSGTDKNDDVVKELQIAISLDPSFADSYNLLALAQARSGDLQHALVSAQKAVSLNPQNENYRFNLTQIYLTNGKSAEGMAELRRLSRSADSTIAQRAEQSLARAQDFQATMPSPRNQRAPVRGEAPSNIGDSALEEAAASVKDTSHVTVSTVPQEPQTQFLKGTVVGIECSPASTATLIVSSGNKSWTMLVKDNKMVPVVGADAFSCGWKQQRVAINYLRTGDSSGEVISIEIQ